MSTPCITAALIVQNEAEQIPGLLAGLSWVDDIIALDGGSHDNTVDLLRAAGVRVLEHPFDTFAAQRNRVLAAVRTDWVFSIDADERPLPGLAVELRELLSSGRVDAVRIPRHSTIFGRPLRFGGLQDDCPLRVFRTTAAQWHGAVHEDLNIPGRIVRARHGLAHVTLPSLGSFLAKMEHYTTLEAHARVAAGRAPRLRDFWLTPAAMLFRRLVWRAGFLDGPEGWLFAALSGLSEAVLARKHAALWQAKSQLSVPRDPGAQHKVDATGPRLFVPESDRSSIAV